MFVCTGVARLFFGTTNERIYIYIYINIYIYISYIYIYAVVIGSLKPGGNTEHILKREWKHMRRHAGIASASWVFDSPSYNPLVSSPKWG